MPSGRAVVWVIRIVAMLAFVAASAGILGLQRLSVRQDHMLAALGELQLAGVRATSTHLNAAVQGVERSDGSLAASRTQLSERLDRLAVDAPAEITDQMTVAVERLDESLNTTETLLVQGKVDAARDHADKRLRVELDTYLGANDEAMQLASREADRVQRVSERGALGLALLALVSVGVLVSQASRLSTRASRAEQEIEDTQPFLTLVRNASDLVTVLEIDGLIRFQNEALEPLLGHEHGSLDGTPLAELVHADDVLELDIWLDRAAQGEDTAGGFECRWRHADGSWRTCDTTIANLLGEPTVRALVLTTRDTTSRHTLERELRAVVDTSPLAIVEIDPAGVVRRWNAAAEALYGFTADEAIGHSAPHVPDGEHESGVYTRVLAGEVVTGAEVERLHRDGRTVQVTMSMVARYDGAGAPVGIVSFHLDSSDRHELEQRLRHQAFHDSLTQLANRELFTDRVEHALATAARRGRPLAVLFLDLDDFKTVNDSLGHAAGDALLKTVAQRIEGRVRRSDTAARLGGDEFAVLLEDLDNPADAEAVAHAILGELREPLDIAGREVIPRGSIGIAHGTGEETAEVLLRNADVAMYEAKNAGKGQVRCFEPVMFEAAVRRLEHKTELRRAVTDGGIVLFYQPVVRLEDEAIVGVESLVRWIRRDRELVEPSELIPLASELGLCTMLGREVLRQACVAGARLGQWRQDSGEEPLWVAVNVSSEHLLSAEFANDVARALNEAGLRPGRLMIEITEEALLSHPAVTIETLETLKKMGVQVSFDDFGSGVSSLSHLQQAPIDFIKLDRQFVEAFQEGSMQSELARMVVQLGHRREITTVAEGIERAEQAEALHALGCELAQGFHFGRPEPLDALAQRHLGLDLSQIDAAAQLDGGAAEPGEHLGVVGDAADLPLLLGLELR
ncbi:MAG: EAL domain-containing protein [Acidimicrobiia bacterium]|nr:EAL domain-containing protein [Acidimicrobiia bacterium]